MILSWGYSCRYCLHCKTRTFRSWDALKEWVYWKDCLINKAWSSRFERQGFLVLYWCSKERTIKPCCTTPVNRDKSKFCSELINVDEEETISVY